jgi:class 3 adenylate cyclase
MRSLGLVATKTLMFLFADMEDSAAMGRRPVDAWAGMVARYHQLIRAGLAAHGG